MSLMHRIRRCFSLKHAALFSVLVVAAGSVTGCSMLPHAMQPRQLRKLNRGPELGRDSYHFSIPDPLKSEDSNDSMMHGDPFH